MRYWIEINISHTNPYFIKNIIFIVFRYEERLYDYWAKWNIKLCCLIMTYQVMMSHYETSYVISLCSMPFDIEMRTPWAYCSYSFFVIKNNIMVLVSKSILLVVDEHSLVVGMCDMCSDKILGSTQGALIFLSKKIRTCWGLDRFPLSVFWLIE